jgi:hypothetical protein
MQFLRYSVLAALVLAACSSSDSTTGSVTDEHGCAPGETYCHGCNGSGFCGMGGCPGFQCAEPIAEGGSSGGAGGTSENDASSGMGGGGSSSTGGAGTGGSSGIASDGGPISCDANFKSALVKDCQSETDCALLNHNDCCGTVVIAVKKGTEATFTAAESAFQTCVPGCGLRGCFHADMSEDMKHATSPGMIVAVCQNKLCMSTIP